MGSGRTRKLVFKSSTTRKGWEGKSRMGRQQLLPVLIYCLVINRKESDMGGIGREHSLAKEKYSECYCSGCQGA